MSDVITFVIYPNGCKHGKVEQKIVLVSQNHLIFSQTLKRSSDMLFKFIYIS